MSCCGRRAVSHQSSPPNSGSRSYSSTIPAPSDPVFEYVGTTSLIVTGPMTGRSYRFDKMGARQPINKEDAPSLLFVPNLRPVVPR